MRLKDYFYHASQRLQQCGISTARLDARVLICYVLGWKTEQFVAHDDVMLTEEQQHLCDMVIARRAGKEPVAYIIGTKEFWGREFKVTSDTLIPRPDSETLIEIALDYISCYECPTIMDLGTGSGCLLLTLLMECRKATGVGVDISAAALDVAMHNAKQLGCEAQVSWVESDWLSDVENIQPYDVIIANPPYIAESDKAVLMKDVLQYEPHGALFAGSDGLRDYRILAASLPAYVHSGSMILLEIGKGQAKDVIALMELSGFRHKEICNDLAGLERCLVFDC